MHTIMLGSKATKIPLAIPAGIGVLLPKIRPLQMETIQAS